MFSYYPDCSVTVSTMAPPSTLSTLATLAALVTLVILVTLATLAALDTLATLLDLATLVTLAVYSQHWLLWLNVTLLAQSKDSRSGDTVEGGNDAYFTTRKQVSNRQCLAQIRRASAPHRICDDDCHQNFKSRGC